MRLLDRYLLRELLVPLGYCLSGFLIFWLAFVLFSELDDFQRAGLGAGQIATYLFLTLPKTLGYVMPLGLLLALLYALTNHGRHHELTAMRSAGVSLWRLSAPYFAVGALCGGLLFLVNEILMPDSVDRAERMVSQPKGGTEWEWHQPFFSFADGRTNIVGPFEFNPRSGEMRRALVGLAPRAGGRIEIKADHGVFSNGCWHFSGVQLNVYRPGDLVPQRQATNHLAVTELRDPPDRIRSESKVASMSDLKAARGLSLSLREIREYFRWHPEKQRDPRLVTKYHVRLAAPATFLVIVLIALPFGARSGRRNVFVGVASSVFFAFAYFILQRFAEAAGMGGKIPPWLAGWLPNLIFALGGIIMTFRTR